jgi:hypothetical protein
VLLRDIATSNADVDVDVDVNAQASLESTSNNLENLDPDDLLLRDDDPHEVAWFFFNFFSIVSSKNNLAKLFPVVFLIVKLAKSKNNLKVSNSQIQSKNN